ncbi:hypothetical protein MLD38_006124 [Melastoma candidum]|uniref:Uncharacterized protein n=1 Tax=Melastoma candidum TaxID=119954 RepID=A0ACB9RN61_9MYRT|nr:hypothetical protein MLD38_006124 [Melastoma candidum]
MESHQRCCSCKSADTVTLSSLPPDRMLRPLAVVVVAAALLWSSSSMCLASSRAAQPPSPRGKRVNVAAERDFVGEPPMYSTDPFEDTTVVVLAAQRTYRKDPLDGFKKYSGGWNLRDRHYLASAGFTAAPLFTMAAIWALIFGVSLLVFFVSLCCCSRGEIEEPDEEPSGHSGAIRLLCLVLLIICSVVAIFGCVILYAGQGKFQKSAGGALDFLVNQADVTVGQLREMSDYIASSRQLEVDKVPLPSSVQTDIDQIAEKINTAASTISGQSVESSDDIRHQLNSVKAAVVIVSATVIVVTFLGLLSSAFGLHLVIYVLVLIGWLLVAGTFIMAGTFLILHNVTEDTCIAMGEWVQIPTPHTALDQLLPCVDDSIIQETQTRSKEITNQLVEVVNQVITNVSNLNFSPNFPEMYINQSGPPVPILCNPFHADLTDRQCSANEANLNNATEVWRSYVCQVSATGICTTPGRLTPTFYDQMSAVVKACYGLYTYGPALVELQDCSVVRQTFSDIYTTRCPAMQRSSKLAYVGLTTASVATMISVTMWLVIGKRKRGDVYEKQQEAGALTTVARTGFDEGHSGGRTGTSTPRVRSGRVPVNTAGDAAPEHRMVYIGPPM